jgi:hypothetical protein
VTQRLAARDHRVSIVAVHQHHVRCILERAMSFTIEQWELEGLAGLRACRSDCLYAASAKGSASGDKDAFIEFN